MNDREALKQVIRANHQLRMMLDAQLAEKGASLYSIDSAFDMQPFFYTAVGNDDEEGITFSPVPTVASQIGVNNPSYGFIRMNDDVPFIATHIQYAYQYTPYGAAGSYIEDGLDKPLGFRILDITAGQQLTVTQRGNTLNGDVLPSRLLVQEQFTDVGGLQLSSEQEFAPGTVLRIEAYSEQLSMFSDGENAMTEVRVHFTLCGYKVFGG